MSGIFGAVNRNNEPVSPEMGREMLRLMSSWQPDAGNTWLQGSAMLGHTMLWTTPRSRLEKLPATRAHLSITMDARLDNRRELANTFGISTQRLAETSDSDLILTAYQKWGAECPGYLLGDFSFAIWDMEKRELFCARDQIGIKQLYYYLDGGKLIFSNDIRCLSSLKEIPDTVCKEAVAIYLTEGELWHPSLTFLEAIRKLPPASTMRVTADGAVVETYWRAEESKKVRYKTVDQYSQHLRELIEDSVIQRCGSEYPIAAHLSGGLDSSPISAIAARHLRLTGRNLHAFNWVPSPPEGEDATHYEWANSMRIAELEQIDHHYTPFTGEALLKILQGHDIRNNDTVDLWYEFHVRKEAGYRGVRTILSGWGGDELISYAARAYVRDLFCRGRVIKALTHLAGQASGNTRFLRSFIGRCYYNLVVPLSPALLRPYLPRMNHLKGDYLGCARPEFADFARSCRQPTVCYSRTIHEDQLFLYNQGHLVNRIESWASSAMTDRIEYSYPLLDRRIVEFALGIPASMYHQQDQNRFVYRQAIKGYFPEDLRQLNFKAEPFRISQYIDIQKGAIRAWLENYDSQNENTFSSPFIDEQRLRKSISDIINVEAKTAIGEFDRLDLVIKSILTLKLTESKKAMHVPVT